MSLDKFAGERLRIGQTRCGIGARRSTPGLPGPAAHSVEFILIGRAGCEFRLEIGQRLRQERRFLRASPPLVIFGLERGDLAFQGIEALRSMPSSAAGSGAVTVRFRRPL